MTFAEEVRKANDSVEKLKELSLFLTEENIEAAKKVAAIDIDEIVTAATVLSAYGSELQTVNNGMDSIKKVIKAQNQIQNVSDIRDSIGVVVNAIDEIKKVADYANIFGGVAAMKPMIDEVLKLSIKMDLVLDLEEKMDLLLAVEKRLDSKLEEMSEIETRTNKLTLLTIDTVKEINVKEKNIDEKLVEVKGYRDEMVDFNIDTEYIPYTSESISEYVPRTNTLVLKIKEGKQGARGESGKDGDVGQPGTAVHKGDKGVKGDTGAVGKDLQVDAMGTKSERTRYGNRPVGFTFLALNKKIPMLYFRKSNTLDDWTDGIPFGSNPIKHADNATNAEKLMGMTLAELKAYINK